MPRPGTAVIPHGWAAHHRPVTTAAMTATCSLTHPGGTGKTFDPTTGTTSDTPNTAYVTSAPCAVMSAAGPDAARLFGEQLASTLSLVVKVDWTAAGSASVKVDDVLVVTAVDDNGDPTLVNRSLRVAGVARSSVAWERLLGCVDMQG